MYFNPPFAFLFTVEFHDEKFNVFVAYYYYSYYYYHRHHNHHHYHHRRISVLSVALCSFYLHLPIRVLFLCISVGFVIDHYAAESAWKQIKS